MTADAPPPAPPSSSEVLLPKGRLEAFSDGVFAIAVTLLVLELAVPEGEGRLGEALLEEWPSYLAYVISFAFIGASWIAHSTMTRFLVSVDGALMRLNLVLLLLVSVLPFTTSLMATHLNATDARTVTVIFGLNLTLAAVMVSVLIGYAGRSPELGASDVGESELVRFEHQRRGAVALQAASTVLAVFLPVAATVVYLIISVLLLVDPLVRMRRR